MKTWRELEEEDMQDQPTGKALLWAFVNAFVMGILFVSITGICWFANYYLTK